MTPRRRSRDLEPLHGEVVSPPAVEARPVVRRERAVVESVAGLPVEPRVVNNYYVQAPQDGVEGWRPRWGLLLAYAFGIAMLAIVLFVLVAGGVIDLSAVHAPWHDAAPHVKGTGR